MDTFLVILGLLTAFAGFAGCILPVLPGPPLSFIALLLLSLAEDWQTFSVRFLLFMGLVMAIVTLMDYVIPALGAKRYGSSKFGVWGSIAGMLVGLIFFSFVGMFIGGWLGAVGGELYAGKTREAAMRAGWGVFLGNLAAIGVKLAYSGVVIFFYIRGMF